MINQFVFSYICVYNIYNNNNNNNNKCEREREREREGKVWPNQALKNK